MTRKAEKPQLRSEQRLSEILRRVAGRRRMREKRITHALSSACLVLSLGVCGIVRSVCSSRIGEMTHQSVGTVLLRDNAGSYVAVGVTAFAVGVALTVICIKFKRGSYFSGEDAIKPKEENK